MGKHSASGRTPASTPQPATEPAAAPPVADVVPTSAPVKPLPSVVQQTIIFGAIAALVAAVALIWAGVNGRTAFLVGLGLVLIGAVAFAVLYRSGLITAPGDEQREAPPEQHL